LETNIVWFGVLSPVLTRPIRKKNKVDSKFLTVVAIQV